MVLARSDGMLLVQFCKCRPGYDFKRLNTTAQCVRARHVNTGVVVLAVVFGVVVFGLVVLAAILLWRYKLLPAAAAHHRMKGPPGTAPMRRPRHVAADAPQ